jgi:DNA-binding IclR family transcriptional regulator
MHAGAASKVLLAWDAGLRARLPNELAPVGPSTATSTEQLERELASVRRRGYATSTSEVVAGAAALAVPVFGSDGQVAAAINVAGPANRWSRAAIAEHVPGVLHEAHGLMTLLASTGPPSPARR